MAGRYGGSIMNNNNIINDRLKWLQLATTIFAITMKQLNAKNDTHKFYAKNLHLYASNVSDKMTYHTFIRYNKDVLLAIKGK